MDDEIKYIDGFIIDLDGVIYRGNYLIPGSRKTLELLEKYEKKYIFVTNNTCDTKEDIVRKLNNFGISVNGEQILTVNEACIEYIKKDSNKNRVQILGVGGILKDFEEAGFKITEDSPDYVIVGWDTEINYKKLKTAINNVIKGSKFIVTSPDRTVPSERDLEVGPGSLAAPIEYATEIEPIYIGKPCSPMITSALNKINVNPENAAIIGDTFESDIEAKKLSNLRYSILVLSGNTKKENLKNLKPEDQPDLILDSLKDLQKYLLK